MQTNYTTRVLTILVVFWVAVSAIYQRVPGSLFWLFDVNGPVSLQHSLKPGIDMAGGTSLTYEIQKPEGGIADEKLAERVATALKQRVDPQGVRNLIWRPQGATRLEIQMPMTRQSEEGAKLREVYNSARESLEATNVRVPVAVGDIETLTGTEREQAITRHAAGNYKRLQLLQQMAKLWDDIKFAREKKDAKAAATARLLYDPLQAELVASNLSFGPLEAAMELSGAERAKRITAIKDQASDYPARAQAIDTYVASRDAFAKVRDSLDGAADLKRKLRGSGVLSFHILATDVPQDEYQRWTQRLLENGPRLQGGDTLRWFAVGRPEEFRGSSVPFGDNEYVLTHVSPEHSMLNADGMPKWALRDVSARSSPELNRGNTVNFDFDAIGSRLFGELTTRFRTTDGRRYQLAILLDDKIISAPSLNEPIFGGVEISSGQSGGFSKSELDYLVTTLGAGSLPAQLTNEPISEITVGPQLGADNLRAGLFSCAAAMVIVFIFLVGYYYLSGFIAFIAVVINLILIIGCMAAINATFTLPGIAGIVLSVAMAVDANVLIFERLREEQARGLSLKMALRNAYDRAFSAIIDGQLTTAISSVFLFWFGSEEVRGFGLTLLIGIATSLFTSLYVTRAIFDIMVDKFGVKDLSSIPRSFPKWNRMLTPRIDWVKLAWPAAVFSTLFISAGMLAFGVKLTQGQALDIEFAGGTSVRVELRDGLKLDRAGLQKAVDTVSEQRPADLAAPRVVSLEGGRLFEISTPTTSATAVQKAVVEGLGDKLKISQPSRFEGLESDYEQALSRTVFPIEDARTRVEGVPPYLTQGHVGGVAIVLNQLSPALNAKTIKERIDQRKDTESPDSRPERVEVQTFDNDTRAVVVISDPRYTYNTANATALQQWQTSLAGPAWQIVKDAVNNPPQLKGVTSFNAQIAGEAKSNTLMAMAFSILGIMAYIWVRFGNLKFGFATVIACVHDGLFVVACIGFSYYLGQIGFFENVLLIKPFRVDLTLVAAVLTVVGYSMNDTVVVFDRIRENRGKFGVLSRQVINNSINQTFSRTLLTGGTSIGILGVMYVIGGDGIHAFTFAMLLGIVVGTYSSVLIAAPLLLIGKDVPQASRAPTRALPI